MTFFNKYLKYKKKYLNLKNNIQIGRGPPLNNIIKSIGLFDKGSDIDNFLNPIYGFIYINTDFIKNHKKFYNEGDTNISSFINTYFHLIDEIIQPTIYFLEKNIINSKHIGIMLGCLYNYKNHHNEINSKIQKLKNEKICFLEDKYKLELIESEIKLLKKNLINLKYFL